MEKKSPTGLLRPSKLESWSRAIVATCSKARSFLFPGLVWQLLVEMHLASEDVDEVLDDSAVVAAARRGGAGQDLDQGGGGGGWRGGGGAGGGGGVAPAEQAETEEPALRSCRDDAKDWEKAHQIHFGFLGEEELDFLDLAGSFSPTKFFRRQLRFI